MLESVQDGLLARGAYAPAMPQAGTGRPGRFLGASAARSDDGDRHATSLNRTEHTPGVTHTPRSTTRAMARHARLRREKKPLG